MTVSTTASRAGPFVGDGSTTTFFFSFQVQQPSDVKVVTTVPGSPDVTLVFGTDYAVSINSDQVNSPGGSVVIPTAPAVGVYVTVLRSMPLTQSAAFPNQGGFYPNVLEAALDKLTLLIGQVLATQGQYFQASTMFSGSLAVPGPGAGKYLRWNLAGTALELVDGTGTTPGNFLQSGTGAVARTLSSKLGEFFSLKDFGAAGDGSTDDTTAINLWLAALGSTGMNGFIPAGTYNFTSALQLPLVNNVVIEGAGSRKSAFNYVGGGTTIDLVTAGNGSTAYTGYALRKFSIKSATVMTGGNALRVRKMANGTIIEDVDFGQIGSALNLYNGLWLDNSSVVRVVGSNVAVSNDGVRISGVAGADTCSDVFLDNCMVENATNAFRVGGGMGRVVFGKVLAIGSTNANFSIDHTLVAQRNRDLFFSDQVVSDSCKNYGFYINDSSASGATILINAQIGNAGLTGSGGTGINLCVASWPSGRVNLGPGQIVNATSHGVRVDDATSLVTISHERAISNNGGYGIYASVATSNIAFLGFAIGNTSGVSNANVSWKASPAFVASINLTAAKGHVALGSLFGGFIIQWGVSHVGDITGTATVTPTFDIAFPTACLRVIANAEGSVAFPSTYSFLSINSVTLTNFVAYFYEYTATTEDASVGYIALGY